MTILKTVEHAFRHAVVYPLLRCIFHNKPLERRISIHEVNKLLVLRYDRIGDMLVTTPVFRALKQANPRMHLAVFASPANAEIIRINPHVDQVYVLSANWITLLGTIRRARRERYDVVLNFIFNRTTSGALLANLIAPRGIKVGQGEPKYAFYFNRLLTLPRVSTHMVDILFGYLREVFGMTLEGVRRQPELFVDDGSRKKVAGFLAQRGLKVNDDPAQSGYVVMNLSAVDEERGMSDAQAIRLAWYLASERSLNLVLMCAPWEAERKAAVGRQVGSPRCHVFPEHGTSSLMEVAALIEGAHCVFTPDTSIVHFCAALGTPVMAMYDGERNVEWLPLGSGSASILRAGEGKHVATIDAERIVSTANEFLQSLQAKAQVP